MQSILFNAGKIITLAGLLFGLSSCATPLMSLPTVHSIPLMSDSGELKVSANIGTPSSNLDLTYAFTSHFLMNANYNSLTGGNMFELSGGYYTKMDDNDRFEILGGIGYGNENYNNSQSVVTYGWLFGDSSTYQTVFKTGYLSLFVQPEVGEVGKIGECGIAVRFSYLSYPGFFYDYSDVDYWTVQNEDISNHRNGDFSIEPTTYFAIGYKYIKIRAQLGFLIGTGPTKVYNNPAYYGVNASAGIQIRLFNKWRDN